MNTDLDEKQESVRGRIYRYSTSWIHGLETEKHWRHYWYQQKIMQGLVVPGDHVLEIGIGTGFTANYLKSKGVKVTTLDIDQKKKPDIHANVVTYNFDQVFDHILAFEVFEHIPFEEIEKLVPRLTKSCQKYFFTSVPRNEVSWCRLEFWLPRLKQRALHLATRKGRIIDPHHYWEMDWKGITKQKFNMLFSEAGFEMLLQKKHWSLIYSVYKSH